MGYRVVTKRFLNEAKSICLFEIEAPLIARHAMAGQFVIFRLDEQGERVPVSVAGYDREKGTVTVMVQAAGRTTKMLHTVEEGDIITDIVGPLGRATEMDGLKKVCVVGGGVGCAIAYPIAKEMHEKGIEVTFIGGFRSADIVILKEELAAASDKLVICTDDGTYVSMHPESAFSADVDVVEMLGAETYLYVTVNGSLPLTARVDPTTSESRVGEVVDIAVDANRVHLFDKDTEQSIIS